MACGREGGHGLEIEGFSRRPPVALPAFEELRLARGQVEYAGEVLPTADRPVGRDGCDSKLLFDLGEDRQRLPTRPVNLVDECDHRQPSQRAHLEELLGLRFDALGQVDYHHRTVGRQERAVGVVAEVVMPGSVEQIDPMAVEVEHQHG